MALKYRPNLSKRDLQSLDFTVNRFLRATAVPAGTAEARISYGNSVCLSVCLSVRHGPVQKQPSDIETPSLHHMIA